MPAPFIQQITILYVSDLEASEAFYGGLLRLPLARIQDEYRFYRIAPNAYLGLCERRGVLPACDGMLISLVTEDVEGWYAVAVAHCAEVEGRPEHNDHTLVTSCFLRDPDGYRVEIVRPDVLLNGQDE